MRPIRLRGWSRRVNRRALRWACASAAVVLPIVVWGQPSRPDWPPSTLRETGLYSDWASKTVAPGNLHVSPQYPLWTDGAAKSRWLHVPDGSFIDASNPDVWAFPVGTRLWKEFRFGRRAETRFIERTPAGWQFASYQWNEDESEAPLAPERGVKNSVPIREGVRHAIPSRADCRACHEAGPVRVLGLSALQLSPDRDPNAPHAEPFPADALDLPSLVARGVVRNVPAHLLQTPPRIAAPTPTARAALGYLHGNCGGCHTGIGELQSLALALNYPLERPGPGPAPAIATALGRPSKYRVPGTDAAVERLSAGHPELSVIVARMSSRHPLVQMPPLGTRIVDEEAVGLIERWIAEDLAAGRTEAGARKDDR